MNTNDIHQHLLSKSPWVNPDNTVDTVKAGDPAREVTAVAVGWMATIDDLRAAAELGCGLFITHEPTFWEHQAPEQQRRGEEPGLTKVKLLEETGLCVLRCHDCWDYWPEIGIRAAVVGPAVARRSSGRPGGVVPLTAAARGRLGDLRRLGAVRGAGHRYPGAAGDAGRSHRCR